MGSPWALVATGSPATRRRPILTTANWRLDAERDGDEVTITYADWSRRTEATVDWPADAGDLEVTVVRDPEAGNLSVLVNGEVVLFQPFIFVVPTVRIGRLWTRSPVPTPRCEALTPRIDQATGRRAGSRS